MGSLADSSLGFRNIINPDRPLRACTVAIALATAGTMAEVPHPPIRPGASKF
jgi:hypothetical protein